MPPREDSPYTILGIPTNSDETEIKKAYVKILSSILIQLCIAFPFHSIKLHKFSILS